MNVHVFRLKPGQDLKQSLMAYVHQHQLSAAFMLTCVGSLQHAAIRLANQSDTTHYDDKFEIVSLVGTLEQGGCHLHISLSDGTGKTIGGHLQDGSLIYTTAEVVLGSADNLKFSRELCESSGFPELVVEERTAKD